VLFKRRVRSYVIRAGRMTRGQQRGWDEGWPRLGLSGQQGSLDLEEVFGRSAPCVLEIGFGMGHSLLQMAIAELDKNFIGIEVHRPGVGALLNNALKADIDNLRVFCDDAVEIITQCIATDSLERLQLYFPDPWHKKKHHKRRLVQPGFVGLVHTRLKRGGRFHMATDWEPYAAYMMDVMTAAQGYRNVAGPGHFIPRPSGRPLTRFEQRGHRLGHETWDLMFEKV
jgi:tRNA (guanine-N7-)-methyltransferase